MKFLPRGEYLIWNSHPGVTISWGEYLILHRQPQGPARVPHPQKGPSEPLPRIPRLCPLHQRTAEHAGQLNIWAESWGAGLRGEDLKQLGLKDTPYLVLYISWMGVKISMWLQVESKYIY